MTQQESVVSSENPSNNSSDKPKNKLRNQAKLIEGDVSQTIVKLTIPMVIGIIAIIGFGLVDSYFIGLLGTNELAAVGFTFPVGMVLTNVAIGLGVGVASVLSRTIGGGDFSRAQNLATDSLFLALALVTFICVLGILTIDPLFMAMGAEPEVLPLIREYMEIYYLGIPFLVIPIVGNSAIRATGDTVTPSIIMVVAALGNAILDPLLIFGYWGFPELGIRGAAYATLYAWLFASLVGLWVLYTREKLLKFYIPKLRELMVNWKEVLSIGVPASAAYSLGPLVVTLLVTIVATYGKEAVAGYGVVVRIRAVAIIVVLALSSSLPVFVGQNWGAKKFGRVKESIVYSQKLVVICQIVIALALFAFAKPIAGLFSEESAVIDIIVFMLFVLPISYIGIGWGILASSAFNAVNMPMKAMVVNIVRFLCCNLLFAWVGSKIYGLDGMIIGLAIANLVSGVFAFVWIRNVTFARVQNATMD